MRVLVLLIFFVLWAIILHGQIITTVAGGGGTLGDGGPASSANINNPIGILFNKQGELYIASGFATRVRKIDALGIITTIAGNGTSGYSGDGGLATNATTKVPHSLAIDTVGNIFFTDALNHVVRKINIATGIITTICGNGTMGYSGDNGPATAALLRSPQGICFDKVGNLYIADGSNHVVRKINALGIITTFAGTGVFGYNGDGIAATTAQLNFPGNVEIDVAGNIYIADAANGRIRKVNTMGVISTYAGNGVVTYAGDGMPAANAQLYPTFIKFDLNSELYISDEANYRVYKIGNNGIFYLVAGNGTTVNGGDGGQAKDAGIRSPSGLTFDTCNNLYIGNVNYNRIRKVTFNSECWPVNVKELNNHYEPVSIYPNPLNDELHIDGLSAITHYRILSIAGASLLQGTLPPGTNIISFRGLAPGMYLLELTTEGTRTTQKISRQ